MYIIYYHSVFLNFSPTFPRRIRQRIKKNEFDKVNGAPDKSNENKIYFSIKISSENQCFTAEYSPGVLLYSVENY